MAEQTHAQIRALPKPKPESPSQSQSQCPETRAYSILLSSRQLSVEPDSQILGSRSSSVPETPHSSAVQNSHNFQNPSKIPIRPPKIRKLSTVATAISHDDDKLTLLQTSAEDSSASSSVALSRITTPPANAISAGNRRRGASQAHGALPQIIKPLSAYGEIEIAIRHLRSADPLLGPLIDIYQPPQFESHNLPFHALTKNILYQQLAYKAGTSIYSRFVSLCGGEDAVFPDTVLALSPQQLKQIGVSGRKASYLYDLANKYKSGILSDDTVVKMDDRSLFTMLSMVKGIGSWSVHMFMIFSLHRPDVLPVSDLGVRKGVQWLYGLEELPRPSQMEQFCDKWRPYRSIGAWYMWRFVEGKGAPTAGSAVSLEGNIVQPLQQIDLMHEGHQPQHQLQYDEQHNGLGNLGGCIWNQ